ncbi:MAG: rhombosortase [Pseudomonadota bacterium]
MSKNSKTNRRTQWISFGLNPIILTLSILILITTLNVTLTDYFIFQRSAIFDGEWWRVITGQVTHFTFAHTLYNLVGLWTAHWLFHEQLNGRKLNILWGILLLSVGLSLLMFSDWEFYAGLSGALHGYWIFGLLTTRTPTANWFLAAAGLLILKVIMEIFALFPQDDIEHLMQAAVAVEAHSTGLLVGLALALADQYRLIQQAWKEGVKVSIKNK